MDVQDLKADADTFFKDAINFLKEADVALGRSRGFAEDAHKQDPQMGADSYVRACQDFQAQVKQLSAKLQDFAAQKVTT